MNHFSPPRLTLEQLASTLGGKIAGDHVRAPAPGKGPCNDSLAVWVTPDDPDGFTVHCHNGTDWQACKEHVREKLGLTGPEPFRPAEPYFGPFAPLVSKAPEAKPFNDASLLREGFSLTTTYDYTDAAGALLYQVLRYQHPTKGKTFRQRSPDAAGGWKATAGTIKVLYRLPGLIEAVHDVVLVTEGEKDADRLASLGFVATTVASGTWRGVDLEPLRNKEVFILADNDDTGRQKAREAAGNLNGVAGSARIVHLPDLPEKGDVSDWLEVCNDTLLALDEIGEVEARRAGEIAYMLANGQGKRRADRLGTARRGASWRVLFLSSGEMSLADKMAEAGQRTKAGQEVRFLDLDAGGRTHGAFDTLHGEPDGASFARKVSGAAATSYGTAGPAFVAEIMQDLAAAREQVRSLMKSFEQATRALTGVAEPDGQVLRAIQRFALVAAAGELASVYGITGWPAGACREAAPTVFSTWLAGRGGAGAREAHAAIERTRAFLVAHGESRFESTDGFGLSHPVRDRAGWRDSSHFWIAQDAWKDIHRGSDPTRAAKHLLATGLLVPGDGNHLIRRTPSAVQNRPRCYCIRRDILGVGVGDGE